MSSSGSPCGMGPDVRQASWSASRRPGSAMVLAAAGTAAAPGRSAGEPAAGWLIPQAWPHRPDPARAGLEDRTVAPLARDTSWPGPGMAERITEPLAEAGDPGRMLPRQIARFGVLAGRDLAASAFAAVQARGTYDRQRHGNAQDYQPLSAEEQLELLALRAALGNDHAPAVPAGAADAGRSGPPEDFRRLARLRRPSSPPGPQRPAARHRRVADTHPG